MMTSEKQNKQNNKKLTVAYHDYNKGLNSYAFFKLRDSAVGENLVQDTFTKTWLYLVKGGKVDMMKAFLYHILNNLIVDEYRKRKHKTESIDFLVEKGLEPKDEESERHVDFLDGKLLIGLIAKLPEIYRKIIYMRFVQSMSLKEISLITGRTKNTVAVQIHRGLGKLRILYGHKISFIS